MQDLSIMKNNLILFILVAILFSCSTKKTDESAESDSISIDGKDSMANKIKDENSVNTNTNEMDSMALDTGQKSNFDQVKIGMKITDLKQLFKDSKFVSMKASQFGIKTIENVIVVMKENEPQFLFFDNKGKKTIDGITILNQDIILERGVHVGLTYLQFTKLKQGGSLTIDTYNKDIECIYVPEKKYRVEFLTSDSNRVGQYKTSDVGYELIKVIRPESKINRISMY